MADVNLTAAFSSVPAGDAEAIKRLLVEVVEQIARDDGTFQRAKLVFTESDERCGLTAELDGVKKEGVPLITLFHEGRAVGTLLLWTMQFMNLINLYMLSTWLPTTRLSTPTTAE